MRIIVFGATGNVGSRIVAEALLRGHEVTAVVRRPEQYDSLPIAAKTCLGDATSVEQVSRLIAGHDLVITALRPPTGKEQQLVAMTEAILSGAGKSGVRVLVVGGAASLKIPGKQGTTVLTEPGFLPEAVLDIARACLAQHNLCQSVTDVDWAYFSPPALLVPGQRTGKYRLGQNELVVDKRGNSEISMEDFAVVMLDEAERPRHYQARFTAAY